ncbi:ATP-binding cassette domain-containing protein [Thermodesulfobacteriota bacterium]
MALIGARDVCWGFGKPLLLDHATFQIEKGERVCLMGRNGVGKTTMLKLLCNEIHPDSGEIWQKQGVSVSKLEQDVPAGLDGTIFDVMAGGLGEKGRAIGEYNRICNTHPEKISPELIKRREALQHRLYGYDGWDLMTRIEAMLSRIHLNGGIKFEDLSAGMKRRVLLARAIVLDPDVLLLDEPTNHLDIDAIIWLEEFIQRHVKTLLFVTHDRALLKQIATRIMLLDRGRLTSFECDYETYIKRRQHTIETEQKQNNVFDKKLAQEETWIRSGVKARRTRNEGRLRALMKMRDAFRRRRLSPGSIKLGVQEAEKTGKLVIEARSISFFHEQKPIIRDFSTFIMRGDKIGIIGPNGVGKTTLLNILLNQIPPQTGTVRHGTNLHIAWFDQLREQLDEQKTIIENIGEGNDFVVTNGVKRHVIGYLKDFLFSSERCHTPVHILSGGEKNRLLLAKLFVRPANVLVLDEPTNDLDAETLELLEDLLFEFTGTVLLVSHDRVFLNNVVAGVMVFEENGRVMEYAGGYDDWLIQRPKQEETVSTEKKPIRKLPPKPKLQQMGKLGYKEKRELDSLPQKIDVLESKQQTLYAIMSDPLFYKKEKNEIAKTKADLEFIEHEIDAAFRKWEEFEKKRP